MDLVRFVFLVAVAQGRLDAAVGSPQWLACQHAFPVVLSPADGDDLVFAMPRGPQAGSSTLAEWLKWCRDYQDCTSKSGLTTKPS
jgi:hypothetical protein